MLSVFGGIAVCMLHYISVCFCSYHLKCHALFSYITVKCQILHYSGATEVIFIKSIPPHTFLHIFTVFTSSCGEIYLKIKKEKKSLIFPQKRDYTSCILSASFRIGGMENCAMYQIDLLLVLFLSLSLSSPNGTQHVY